MKIQYVVIALSALLLGACGSNSGEVQNEVAAEDSVQAEEAVEAPLVETVNYRLIPETSTFTWIGRKATEDHTGLVQPIHGVMGFSDDIILHGVVELDMNSISCIDITDEKSNAKLVKHLKGTDFFNADEFPVVAFELTEWTPQEDKKQIDIAGQLTIKGISSEVRSTISWIDNPDTSYLRGDVIFDRTIYDIKYKSKTIFPDIGDKFIYDDIIIQIDAAFLKMETR